MIIMSVDPSINFCGFAIHDEQGLLAHTLLTPNKTDEDYVQKSRTIFSVIKNIHNDVFVENGNKDVVIVLECPEYWKVAGHAARESGSIFKLTFLCGMIATINDSVVIVTPSGWKGQMSKDVVNRRLRATYPNVNIEKTNHNVVDAIGIGRWYIDKVLNKVKP